MDVRLAIGIGDEHYSASKITESNGTAYVNSGDCFEKLKKYTLAIKTGNKAVDEILNIMLRLSALTLDNWSSVVSTVIRTAIENPGMNQQALAKILQKSQSNISEAFTRGGYEEIMNLNEFYIKTIKQL